jgi:hypothetical protein
MHTGAPAIFNASASRDNALLHWRMGNHPSINQKRLQVMATMKKEARNCYVIPLPSWIARFCPNMFFTPQHILEKPGQKDRQIFDASHRFTPTSVPLNMMTQPHSELSLVMSCSAYLVTASPKSSFAFGTCKSPTPTMILSFMPATSNHVFAS